MIFVTPITTSDKSGRLKSHQGRTCKADHTDNRRVNDLSNKETIEHLICITKFFLNDSCPLIWKNTIQKQPCLCTKQFPAGKKINGESKIQETCSWTHWTPLSTVLWYLLIIPWIVCIMLEFAFRTSFSPLSICEAKWLKYARICGWSCSIWSIIRLQYASLAGRIRIILTVLSHTCGRIRRINKTTIVTAEITAIAIDRNFSPFFCFSVAFGNHFRNLSSMRLHIGARI